MDGMSHINGWMSVRRASESNRKPGGKPVIMHIALYRGTIEDDLRTLGYRQSSQPRLWIRGVGDCIDVLPMTVEYALPE